MLLFALPHVGGVHTDARKIHCKEAVYGELDPERHGGDGCRTATERKLDIGPSCCCVGTLVVQVEGKAAARETLRYRMGLTGWGDKPLVGVVTRLTAQKGASQEEERELLLLFLGWKCGRLLVGPA